MNNLIDKIFFYFFKFLYKTNIYQKLDKFKFYYVDCSEYLLINSMEALCEFYESKEFKLIDWDFTKKQKEVKKQIELLYNWWKFGRPQKLLELQTLLDTWSEHSVFWLEKIENENEKNLYEWKLAENKYADYLFKLHADLEKEIEKKEDEMLISLMKIRRYLWF